MTSLDGSLDSLQVRPEGSHVWRAARLELRGDVGSPGNVNHRVGGFHVGRNRRCGRVQVGRRGSADLRDAREGARVRHVDGVVRDGSAGECQREVREDGRHIPEARPGSVEILAPAEEPHTDAGLCGGRRHKERHDVEQGGRCAAHRCRVDVPQEGGSRSASRRSVEQDGLRGGVGCRDGSDRDLAEVLLCCVDDGHLQFSSALHVERDCDRLVLWLAFFDELGDLRANGCVGGGHDLQPCLLLLGLLAGHAGLRAGAGGKHLLQLGKQFSRLGIAAQGGHLAFQYADVLA